MTLALLRYQLVAMFLDMLAWKIAFSPLFDALRPNFSGASTPLRGATPARRTSE
jgi:hypothetical protein